jgi:lysozyme
MTPEGRQQLKKMLLKDEKYSQYPYVDTTGHLTIAIGQNISPSGDGISMDEALYILDNKITNLYNKISHYFSWFMQLTENRQIALLNMTFNLGFEGFLKFHKMLLALECHDYERAAYEMLESKWVDQVGDRATRLANIIKTGEV